MYVLNYHYLQTIAPCHKEVPSHFKDPWADSTKLPLVLSSHMFITLNQPCRKTNLPQSTWSTWDAKEEEAVEEAVSAGAEACSGRDQVNSTHLTR